METTGTFVAEDAFRITKLGWVLTGDYSGSISPGQQLVFATGLSLRIKAVNWLNIRSHSEKIGLLLEADFESRQQLLDLLILGAAATVSEWLPPSSAMLRLIRTTSENSDFQALVRLLDQDLAERDGADNAFYAQFNKIDLIRHAVVAYLHDEPAGCGAFKQYESGAVEIKRMYVQPAHRQQGVAQAVLAELERWATELGYTSCVLETGKRQPEAIALYHRCGYADTPNYGQYVGVENSVCMRKEL